MQAVRSVALGGKFYRLPPDKENTVFPTLFVKTTDFQLAFDFEQTRTVTIFGKHGIMAHIMAKPIRALELHYPMVQFLIITNIINFYA